MRMRGQQHSEKWEGLTTHVYTRINTNTNARRLLVMRTAWCGILTRQRRKVQNLAVFH